MTETGGNGSRLTGASIMAQAAGHRPPASEATSIEQSRAIAQVQGALIVAQQRPRSEVDAMARIRDACGIQELADRAFYRFPRDGQTVTGPSIHLATELARCWGNVDYGIAELRRDMARGESEMLAWAWDLETNSRVVNSFIVPHMRDKRGGPVPLRELRDLYENNANQGARRLRECVLRVLPVYVVEEAKRICYETLKEGGGVPIAERRAKTIEAFKRIGVTRRQLEKRMASRIDDLDENDLAQLRVIYTSITRGELDKAEEFPPDQGEEISAAVKGKATAKAEKPAAEPEPADHDPATGEMTEPEKHEAAKPNGNGTTAKERAKEIAAAIRAAPNVDALRKLYARLSADVARLPDKARIQIAEIYDEVVNGFSTPDPTTVTDADRAAVESGHHFDDLEPEEWKPGANQQQPGLPMDDG